MSAREMASSSVPRSVAVEQVLPSLLGSANACDQRKGRDLRVLVELAHGEWRGRFEPVEAASVPGRGMAATFSLIAEGLVWRGQPEPQAEWVLGVHLAPNYPLAPASFGFVHHAVPFNPHVMHRDFQPDEATLPPELRPFVAQIRQGRDGAVCFVRQSQWRAAVDYDLARAIWQISRIVTGAAFYGEQSALNTTARDHYLRLADEGRLPLGQPLPLPRAAAPVRQARACASPLDQGMEDDDADVRWLATPAVAADGSQATA